jgi:hypothetical protein
LSLAAGSTPAGRWGLFWIMAKWRTGKKLGRTLYRDGVCVGMVDSSLVAEAIRRGTT